LNILLPSKNGKTDYAFMESFVAEMEAERIAELEAYLSELKQRMASGEVTMQ
jgi:cytochrome c553